MDDRNKAIRFAAIAIQNLTDDDPMTIASAVSYLQQALTAAKKAERSATIKAEMTKALR